MPASRRQSSPTASALSAVTSKPEDTARARSTKTATAGQAASSAGPASARSGTASGCTGYSVSPRTRSGARLVTSTTSRGTGRHERRHLLGGAEQVLEVVQHQQEAQRREVLGEQALGVGTLDRPGAHRAGHRGQHGARVGQGGERDDGGAVGEGAVQLPGERRGQPRLAHAAGAGEGHQALLLGQHQLAQGGELVVPPQHRGGGHRQVPQARGRDVRRRPRSRGRLGGAGGAPAGDGAHELGALLVGGAERVGQRADGVRVGPLPPAALERADGVRGEAGPLGELLLGEAGLLAQGAQPCPEGVVLEGVDGVRSSHGRRVGTRAPARPAIACDAASGQRGRDPAAGRRAGLVPVRAEMCPVQRATAAGVTAGIVTPAAGSASGCSG
jgi:hypothetical protein